MSFLTTMSLGAVIDISTGASMANLNGLSSAFSGVMGKAAGLTSALGQSFQGMQKIALLSAGVGAGLAYMGSKAADFEQGMANVLSVMGQAHASEMPALTARAKELGATTKFSATEAANGMELMARAGFNSQEILSGIGGVLNAAAADNLDLATATDIVASALRGYNLPASDATRVSDVLAKTSSLTNSSITTLGEGFKYVAPIAAGLNLEFEGVSAAMGILHDSGIKASQAGTSLRSALTHIAKPTRMAKAALADMGLTTDSLLDKNGNMMQLPELMATLSRGLDKIPGNAGKIGALAKIFGQEAAPAMLALMEGAKTGRLDSLTEQLRNASGAAEEMANIKMDTFYGQLALLQSAIEGFSIEAFSGFGSIAKDGLKVMVEALSSTVLGMQGKGDGSVASAFGEGIMVAVRAIGDGIRAAAPFVSGFFKMLSDWLGPEGAKKWGMMAVALTAVVAVIGPVVAGLTAVIAIGGALFAVFEPIINLVGIGGVAAFALLVAAALAFFGVAQDSGLSMMQVVQLLWARFVEGMTSTGAQFMTWWTGIMAFMQPAADNLLAAWHEIMMAIGSGGDRTQSSMADIGKLMGNIIGFTAQIIAGMAFWASLAIRVGANIFRGLFEPMSHGISRIGAAMVDFLTGAATFKEAFVSMFAGFSLILTAPIRAALSSVIGMMASVVDNPVGRKLLAMAGIDPESFLASLSNAQTTISTANPTEALFGEREKVDHAKLLNDMLEEDKRAKAGTTAAQATAADPVKAQVTTNTTVEMDGREVARASKRHEVELSERAGYSQTPWQQRQVLERSAVQVGN